MPNLTSELTLKLIDDVTGPARTVDAALKKVETSFKSVDRALAGSGATAKFQQQLAGLGKSSAEIDRVAAAWKEYASSARMAGDASSWTAAQARQMKAWEASTIRSLKEVERQEKAFASQQARMGGAGPGGRGPGGPGTSGASGRGGLLLPLAGIAVAHKTGELAKKSLETYREFDKEARYQAAVMGKDGNALSTEEQAPLIAQAIHGGGTSKYNDIEWLKAQRSLAQRGLGIDQVLGITPTVANLGMATDQTMDHAATMLESAMFPFRKDTSTTEAAQKSSSETSDRMVKAMKISGMTNEDVQQLYKYGGNPAYMAGVNENTLLAFGGIGKKAGMGGQETGTAFRAMMASAIAPTAGARTAMLASGIDYSKYQNGPSRYLMHSDVFARDIAGKYGVKLGEGTKERLDKIFSNKSLVSDPAKFTPAVMKVLEKDVGVMQAKDKKSVASEVQRFRNASLSNTDVPALLAALMKALPGNQQLANAIYGAKQGPRVTTAFDDPEKYKAMVKAIAEANGYTKQIADERMSGFDGAMSRFEGSVKNLETSLGRAFNKEGPNGEPGMLTQAADAMGRVTQGFSELSQGMQVTIATLAGLTAAFVGVKGISALMGGFGLKASAGLLDKAALDLMGAATIMKGGAAAGAAGGAVTSAATAAGLGSVPAALATGARGGLTLGAGAAALQAVKNDSQTKDQPLRTWLREKFGIEDPHEPSRWGPGGTAYQPPKEEEPEPVAPPVMPPMVHGAPFNAYRQQFIEDRGRMGIPLGGYGEIPDDLKNLKPGVSVPMGDINPSFGGGAIPFLDQTKEGMSSLAPHAAAAGQQAGQGFDAGLTGTLTETLMKVQAIMEQIRGAMQFDASPNVSPGGNNSSPAPTPGRQSSAMPGYDFRQTANADISHWSA